MICNAKKAEPGNKAGLRPMSSQTRFNARNASRQRVPAGSFSGLMQSTLR